MEWNNEGEDVRVLHSQQYLQINRHLYRGLVKRYDNTRHSSTKITPVAASLKKNEGRVDVNLYEMLRLLNKLLSPSSKLVIKLGLLTNRQHFRGVT
jgi:hypothetical protein